MNSPAHDTALAGAAHAPAETTPHALQVARLSKTFGATRVLHDIGLEIAPGSVHALLGANGSGKSTVIKCLAGVHRPDHGSEVRVDGRLLPNAYPPSQAREHGMSFVHQDLGLLPRLSVADNLALTEGFPRRWLVLAHRHELRRRAQALMAQVDLDLDPSTLVEELSSTQKTLLAIARAIGSATAGTACLILDEPTASLPDSDAEILFDAVRSISARGVAVMYVSHRMDEIFDLCDRVSVLTDGRVAVTGPLDSFTRRDLVEAIVGQSLGQAMAVHAGRSTALTAESSTPVLRVSELSGPRVRDVSFTINAGEIVGVAGLAGSGRSELARMVAHAQPRSGGQITLNGQPLTSLRQAIKSRVGYVPENRRGEGCILAMPVGTNLTLPSLADVTTWRGLSKALERRVVTDLMRRFAVRPNKPSMPMSSLSGGNQQKVVLAKWMHRDPQLLVLDEPVQGIDVGAKHEIQEHIRQASGGGAAVLVIDSDFENLLELCHRVLVINRGHLIHDLATAGLALSRLISAVFDVESDAHQSVTSGGAPPEPSADGQESA